jgi:hypothetical protein
MIAFSSGVPLATIWDNKVTLTTTYSNQLYSSSYPHLKALNVAKLGNCNSLIKKIFTTVGFEPCEKAALKGGYVRAGGSRPKAPGDGIMTPGSICSPGLKRVDSMTVDSVSHGFLSEFAGFGAWDQFSSRIGV